MKREELVNYTIKGKIAPKDMEKLPKEVPFKAYAVRDRRVVGSALIGKNGAFEVKYKYRAFGKGGEAYGVNLIIGPDLPGDEILKTKLERRFISSGEFKRTSPNYEYIIAEPMTFSEKYYLNVSKVFQSLFTKFTFTGFVFTCDPLSDPPGGFAGCSSPDALSKAEAFVRLSKGGDVIGADIELDVTGQFEFTKGFVGILCLFYGLGVTVEVYQKIGTQEYPLYEGIHDFTHNQAELIFIDKDTVMPIPPEPTPTVGNTFGFERIGNIPVECIFKAGDADLPSAEFIGYVDSSGDRPGIVLGSADLRVKDYAFGGGDLHLYANLGDGFGTSYAGGVDMSQVDVKYFRIRLSYEAPVSGSTVQTWLDTPFSNTRGLSAGGTAADYMGPHTTHPVTSATVDPYYTYPNPYDTDPDKDWKYRGLVMVLNSNALPLKYGRFTFTIEPLDNNLNSLTVTNPQDCVLTILVDNDINMALTGSIGSIMGVGACEILNLAAGSQPITVPFNVDDAHGNLLEFTLTAGWGDSKSLTLIPSVDFALDNTYSRGATPSWTGGSYSVTKDHNWEQCAYEFEIIARRRVTNGFHYRSIYKILSKHITIMHPGTPYIP